jgi:hypothetical protein
VLAEHIIVMHKLIVQTFSLHLHANVMMDILVMELIVFPILVQMDFNNLVPIVSILINVQREN